MAFVFVALPAIGEGLAGLFTAGTAAGGVGSATGAAAGSAAGALGGAGGALGGSGLTMGQIGSGLSATSAAMNIGNKLFGGQNPTGSVGFSPISRQAPGASQIPSSTTNSIDLLSNAGGTAGKLPNEYIAAPTVPGLDNMKHFDIGGFVNDDYLVNGWVDQATVNPYANISGISGDDLSAAYDMGEGIKASDISSGALLNSPGLSGGFGGGSGGLGGIWEWIKKNPGMAAALGLGGLGAATLFSKPSLLQKYQPPTAKQYGLGATLASNYKATRPMAEGGLTTPGIIALNNPYNQESPDEYSAATGGLMGNSLYPMSQQNSSQYSIASQLPSGAHQVAMQAKSDNITHMASGGISSLGSYSDGGRMLKGPGDGMSDDIPATIGGTQPARLADGEFVVPADVVSHMGNGSTDAGAKKLYAMMDNVRKARTGSKKQGKQIKAEKYMPV